MADWTYCIYVVFVGMIALMTATIGIYCLKYRIKQGYPIFSLIMVDCSLWSIACVMRLISETSVQSLFWYRVYFVAAATLPVLWLIFALQYTGYGKWLTRKRLVLLLIVPTITVILSSIDEKRGWFWTLEFYKSGYFTLAHLDRGPGYFLHCIYSYTIALVGVLFCVWTAIRSFHMYRMQALALLVAALLPIISSLSSVLGITQVSYGSFGFALGGILFARAVSRYRLLDLLPVAREALVAEMEDAVFVLDENERILDLNPATERLFECSPARSVGRPVMEAWRQYSEFLTQICGKAPPDRVVTFQNNGRVSYFDLNVSAFKDIQGNYSGRMIILRDITKRKEVENEKEVLIKELQEALSKVRTLSGMLPICTSCKKIRDDEGYWHQVEIYVRDHSEARFTHGICPECIRKLYPELDMEY